jgi:putative MFS transporter
MWFPGGIVVGSLISKFMTDANLSWQTQIWVLMLPTVVYAFTCSGDKLFQNRKWMVLLRLAKNFQAMQPLYSYLYSFAWHLQPSANSGPTNG